MTEVESERDKNARLWPCGRFEVYTGYGPSDERLNGFHSEEEAQRCSERFPGSLVLDRADRFSWGPDDNLTLQLP